MKLQVLLWKQENTKNRSQHYVLRVTVNGTDGRHMESTKRKDLSELEQSFQDSPRG